MSKDPVGSYAPVNGLNMYYEVHGTGTGRPLVLLHGAYSAIGTSFAKVLPGLARTRQVIGLEMQGHGHTADIDRPLTFEQLSDDIAAFLKYLKIDKSDLFGYSVGAAVALHTGIRHPEVVGKLALASVNYTMAGMHPGLMEGMADLQPEHLVGTPWQLEYASIAPNPENWPVLIEKMKAMESHLQDFPEEVIRSLKAPTLLLIGDSDIIRPEHAVEMFRLLGGGVMGDMIGLPNSRLAILPGTTHVTIMDRADWLVSMISEFLDAPMPKAE